MIKPFWEAFKDTFRREKPTQGKRISELRAEGVLVDEEGYFYFTHPHHKGTTLRFEPILEDEDGNAGFLVSMYEGEIALHPKLELWAKKQTENK